MPTLTGNEIAIDTSSLYALLGGPEKLRLLTFNELEIVFKTDNQRLLIFLGNFDYSSLKALNASKITGIEVRVNDEAETLVAAIADFSIRFSVFDDDDFDLDDLFAKNDTFTGSTAGDRLFAFAGDDVIDGRDGNDLIDGGKGADIMRGGAGDDRYIVGQLGDVVEEAADEGIDNVVSSLLTYTLPDDVENLKLAKAAGEATGIGNALDNGLVGNALANRLEGGDGADSLDGGKGRDQMLGGGGDDSYLVDSKGDRVVEAADEGSDTVTSFIDLVLAANVEDLVLVGEAETGIGNAFANTLTGNALNNVLIGGDGDDTFFGRAGKDKLEGDAGADRFAWLRVQDGKDVIRDFSPDDGDVLDFGRIVTGFTPGLSDVDEFLSLSQGKKGAVVSLDVDGALGSAEAQAFAVLVGVDAASTTAETLVDDGNILLA
jgi:Ca2+-binding RTX toxin-like protein